MSPGSVTGSHRGCLEEVEQMGFMAREASAGKGWIWAVAGQESVAPSLPVSPVQ